MYKEISANKTKTVFLMGVFLIIVISLGWVFSMAYNNPAILYIAVGFSFFQAFISYFYSDKITLAMSGAKEIQKKDNPELYRIVENLSITAGLPMPKVYIMNEPQPNAFATGRDPKHSVVAVTTGLLERLNKTELEGVIAHELSHIGNYDIRLMTIVVVLVGIITLLADFFIRMAFYSDRDEKDARVQLIMIGVGILFSILAPLFAMILQLAISRKREYLADASGSLLTRYPEGLASALEKISAYPNKMRLSNNATAHLFISDPRKKEAKRSSFIANLFNTHPPVEERVAKLRNMIS